MNTKPIFLFTFANDILNKLSLDKEWRALEKALQLREQDLVFNLTPSTQVEDVFDKINHFHNRISVFHYGGHSDGEGLGLVDTKLKSDNLAVLLGQEEKLKLVFLNGCSNKAQVQALLDQGVPAVIATSTPIDDQKSIQLAQQFYTALAAGKNLNQAFKTAAAFVNNQEQEVLVKYRGLVTDKKNQELEWGLYINADKKEVLQWKIRKPTPKLRIWQYLTAAAVIIGMLGSLAEILNFIDIFPQQSNANDTGSVTVLVHGTAGKDQKVLPNRGIVYLLYGDAKIPEQINNEGEATFKQIPPNFFAPDAKVEILFEDPEGEPYRAVHRDSLYDLERGKYIALPVLLEGMEQIKGIVKNFETGETLDSVEVRIFGKATYTNKRGEFVLDIPEAQRKQFITIRAYKEGYKNWELSNIPTTTDQEVVIPMKKKK